MNLICLTFSHFSLRQNSIHACAGISVEAIGAPALLHRQRAIVWKGVSS
jgi:hypothetical protein